VELYKLTAVKKCLNFALLNFNKLYSRGIIFTKLKNIFLR